MPNPTLADPGQASSYPDSPIRIALRAEILSALEDHDGLCLDNSAERDALADIIAAAVAVFVPEAGQGDLHTLPLEERNVYRNEDSPLISLETHRTEEPLFEENRS